MGRSLPQGNFVVEKSITTFVGFILETCQALLINTS
jgi:hypothetical protein